MKRKIDLKIPIIMILTIILIIICYFYFKNDNSMQYNASKINNMAEADLSNNENTNTIAISSTSEVSSGLTENLELHATYYLEESYIQTNQLIKAGENILKYTNGTYLVAPYDCVIKEINIPDKEAKCTNEHYVQISSNNILKVQFVVDETKIDNVKLGQEASVEVQAYEDKVLKGIVTNISNTASNGKFTVTVEFENDGEVMIGMTARATIK